MAQDVGQRLLGDPVDDQLQLGGELRQIAGQLSLDPGPALARSRGC